MRKLKIYLLLFIIFIQILPERASAQDKAQEPKARYVFYFIGDGMGLAQINAAQAYKAALQGKIGIEALNMDKLNALGLVSTYAQNRYITCSAAAGTALATGQKTSINTIGMNADRTAPLNSIAWMAKKHGMKVGIITTVSLNHATPAAFYAHRPDRNDYYEIALQLTESNFDLFGLGGLKDAKGKKGDQPDAYDIARQKGYQIVKGREEFMKINKLDKKIIAINANIDPENAEVPVALDRGPEDMSLAEFVSKSIALLDNPNGFFMMVEGGQIDWACHNNDIATTIGEVLDFDQAIGHALDFAQKHPKETLIIVTADHETGGLTIGNALKHYDSDFGWIRHQKASQPALAKMFKEYKNRFCPANCSFDGIWPIIQEKTGLGKDIPLNEFDRTQLQMSFRASMLGQMPFPSEEANYLLFGGNDPLALMVTRIIAQKAGFGWTTWSHTGIPVPVRAQGPGQKSFEGFIDNKDIPHLILKAMGLPQNLN
ncbi:MAG: alkaline phosphatase [Bacteroidales bacterium]|jgi:alkaline phosphatase|nr:alkaline phosphatase [Bacteroidales bacterium]NPV35332.1 alkaline phosphatase [Bacteroidales bacterium]